MTDIQDMHGFGERAPEPTSEEVQTQVIRNVFQHLAGKDALASPRGQLTKEQLNCGISFESDSWLYQTWPERGYRFDYLATEFHWYLRADNNDTSIGEHAKIWKQLASLGKLQSNYGEYLFKQGQLMRCASELRADKFSRRACVMILAADSYHEESHDIPCTMGLQFVIRDNLLIMTVNMRSQDLVFGAGNDWPLFNFTQQILCAMLRDKYPDLQMGPAIHNIGSLHIYERHFEMVDRIATNDAVPDLSFAPPKIEDPDEAIILATSGGRNLPHERFPFSQWLMDSTLLKDKDQ